MRNVLPQKSATNPMKLSMFGLRKLRKTMSNRMFAQTPISDRVDQYERLAPRYDRLHHRWLRHAGGEAQAALEALVRALATPNSKLLDAGCGTGKLARTLIS